jgi:hypothetical protein
VFVVVNVEGHDQVYIAIMFSSEEELQEELQKWKDKYRTMKSKYTKVATELDQVPLKHRVKRKSKHQEHLSPTDTEEEPARGKKQKLQDAAIDNAVKQALDKRFSNAAQGAAMPPRFGAYPQNNMPFGYNHGMMNPMMKTMMVNALMNSF